MTLSDLPTTPSPLPVISSRPEDLARIAQLETRIAELEAELEEARKPAAKRQRTDADAAPRSADVPGDGRHSPAPAAAVVLDAEARIERASMVIDGTLRDLLVSIAPKMVRALPLLVSAGVDDVGTLRRLRPSELEEFLALAGLLPLDRILLKSRLAPRLLQP